MAPLVNDENMKILYSIAFLFLFFSCEQQEFYIIEETNSPAKCLNNYLDYMEAEKSIEKWRWMFVFEPELINSKSEEELKNFWKSFSKKLSDDGIEDISVFKKELKDRIYFTGLYKNIDHDLFYDKNIKEFAFSNLRKNGRSFLSYDPFYPEKQICIDDPLCKERTAFKFSKEKKCFEKEYLTCVCGDQVFSYGDPAEEFALDHECNCWYYHNSGIFPADWKKVENNLCDIKCSYDFFSGNYLKCEEMTKHMGDK